jgi:Bax protein
MFVTVIAVCCFSVWLAVALTPNQRLGLDNSSVETVTETIDLYRGVGFDPIGDIRKGDPKLPPIFLTGLPDDLAAIPNPNTRKAIFVSIVLPHILYANERIRADRRRLQRLNNDINRGRELRRKDRRWLKIMAKTYRTSPMDTGRLLRKVDIIPPRLAIAQAAHESGWGTSRFAQAGNALFGQHAPVGKGTIQAGQNANVALKAFDTLQASVSDYMRNLNRHRAYREFRTTRADMRASKPRLDAVALAETLVRYSEEGRVYVKRIRSLMNIPEVASTMNAAFAKPP